MAKVEKEAKAAEKEIEDFQKQLDKTGIVAKETTAQQKALDIQIKSLAAQHEKAQKEVDDLRQKLIETAKATGANSEETARLAKELSKAESQANLAEKEMSQLKNELDKLSTEASNSGRELKNLSDAENKLDKSTSGISGGFTVLKGVLVNLATEGIHKAIDAFKELVVSGTDALNELKASTNMAAEEINKFEIHMNELYKAAYGENLNDLSEVMSTVAQSSRETDPAKIKELSKYAIVLRDTFGFDVAESMRTANMLIDQFGVDGIQAFNLIAQGAQNGLDKNGDLLDSINEYAVHYKQLNYTAEEFFNSLKNGTDAGTFSVDKLGDAMKEFGIRSKDSSKTTADAFISIGVAAEETVDDLFKEFAEGGQTARNATKEVTRALFSMEDKVEQNKAGVALFGTMWEDLGVQGIEALLNVNGEADRTIETMKEIDSLRYDSVATDLASLGRTIQIDILQPIAEKLIPKIRELVDFIKNNLPQVTALITGVGTAMATLFVANKIMALVTALQSYKTLAELTAAAQTALNAAMSANPVGLVISLIAGLVAAFATLWATSEDFRNFWIDLWEKIKSVTSDVAEKVKNGLTGAWETVKTKTSEVVTAVKDGVKGAVDAALTWGKDLIDNFVQGIKNGIGRVKEAVSEMAQTVKDYIGFSEPEKGPLSNFHTYAPDMIDLYTQGIDSNQHRLIDSVRGMAANVRNSLNFGGEFTPALASGFGAPQISGSVGGGISQVNYITLSIEGNNTIEDIDTITDRAVEQIAYKLKQLQISDSRSKGGTGWI